MNEGIVVLLNKDLMDEHGAIIQYLTHAYAMGETGLACEIEAISREEMRHFDWLARTIVGLGGVPALDRGTMRPDGVAVADWMDNDVLLERDAIAQYQEHIRSIADQRVRRVLERILSDEKAHQGMFQRFRTEAHKDGLVDLRGMREDGLAQALDWGIRQEYATVLQYLFQRYVSANQRVKDEMEDQAGNEMQHMGWLAEKLVDQGGSPVMEHASIDRSTGDAGMLRADLKAKPEMAARYDRFSREIGEPDVRELLSRIREHEVYQEAVFTELLKEVLK